MQTRWPFFLTILPLYSILITTLPHVIPHCEPLPKPKELTPKQSLFIAYYVGESNHNATDAARRAGYTGNPNTLKQVGAENLAKPYIRLAIDKILTERCLSATQVLDLLNDQARGVGEFARVSEDGEVSIDVKALIAAGKGHLIKGVKMTKFGQYVEFYDAQVAQGMLGRHYKLFTDKFSFEGLDDALERELAKLAASSKT